MKLPMINKHPNGTITSHNSASFPSEYPTKRKSVSGVSRGQLDKDMEYSSPKRFFAMVFVIKLSEIGELCRAKLLYNAYASIFELTVVKTAPVITCSL